MTDPAAPLRALCEAVYKKTANGEVEWRFDDDLDACEASIGQGYIQICSEVDVDGDKYFFVKILNGFKQTVDSIYGGTLGIGTKPSTGQKDWWDFIRDLRTMAYRRAVGSEEVINSMLHELDASPASRRVQPPRPFDDLDDDVPF
ncbi:hypothetical protein V6R86_03155 [Sphingomonas kaistensis]|uniref:Uncharacterized protein n=1 Tax=Sphingomonas kaistensis TaxID=298708 RepID=A0ABZ2FYH0_9SPHN